MDEYKSNSFKSRAQEETIPDKKVDKVISGTARPKKKTLAQRAVGLFVPEDVEDVKQYIFTGIVVPLIKKAITDTIDTCLYGEARSSSSNKPIGARIDYSGRFNSDKRDPPRSRVRSNYSFDEVIVNSRGDAEEVKRSMQDTIHQYGIVSIADMYDAVGITPEWTDYKYGWTDIRGAEIVRTRDGGYLIKMPRAIPLE